MTELFSHTDKFVLVLVRTSGVIMVAPVFGAAAVPARIKAAFVLVLSLMLMPVVKSEAPALGSVLAYCVVAVRELSIGLMMGFTAILAFGAFQIAGEFIGRQMGLALGELADPLLEQQASVFSQFHYILAMLAFVAVDGHHWFLQALAASFASIPLGESTLPAAVTAGMVDRFVAVFVAGIKMAAPAVCVLLLVTIGLAMLARAAPLLNMLMISISLRIAAGLVAVGIMIPYVYKFGLPLLQNIRNDLSLLVKAL